jgi:hypothetical protein
MQTLAGILLLAILQLVRDGGGFGVISGRFRDGGGE